jgi:hypothetical protein
MKPLIKWLNQRGFETKACCCGHNRYPMTIVVKLMTTDKTYELLSKKYIDRKRKFYVKDKKGFYYIPEISKEKK